VEANSGPVVINKLVMF